MRLAFMFLALAGASACQLEQFFPVEVANGVARLTVANTGAILRLANTDPACGFDSGAARAASVIEGEPGTMGRHITRIEGCEVNLGVEGAEPTPLGSDCNGNASSGTGMVVLTGTRTIEGLVTGDPSTPIIPQSPDAVSIELTADVGGLHVFSAQSPAHLLMKQGRIEITAAVHLARSASMGVCSVPTDEVTLRNISVSSAVYVVNDGAGREFKVDVPTASLRAQVGAYNGEENVLGGKITVWQEEVDLGDAAQLDPDYSRDAFVQSFSCATDLELPISYACENLRPTLADGAAKLTVSTVGNLTSIFSKDTTCGLKSPQAIANVVLEGETGRLGGRATYFVDEPCELDFGSEGRVVSTDCNGNEVRAYGKARFTGSLSIEGRLTGNPDNPVIPSSRNAVDIHLRLDLEGARVTGQTPESLEVHSGVVTGVMHPHLAVDEAQGACAYDVPIVTFNNLAWEPGTRATIHTEKLSLGVKLDGSLLQAQTGERDGRENHLEGSITLDDETFAIPLPGNPPTLDPSYERATFYDGMLSCEEGIHLAESDDECLMRQIVGDGVARLIVQTVGTVAGAVNANADCGFANTLGVLANPIEVVGEHGEMGSLTWSIEDCANGAPELSVFATDCVGNQTFIEGNASVDSVRTVYGLREPAVDLFFFALGESIEPQDSRSIDLWITETQLNEFSSYGLKAGATEPLGILKIHQGTLDAFVQPATGENTEGGGFVVPTPVATMEDVRLRNATATLFAQGMTFVITIDDTNLTATNGRVHDSENAIAGTVTIDGVVIEVGGALDPEYDAAQFEAGYVCTENLAAPVRLD